MKGKIYLSFISKSALAGFLIALAGAIYLNSTNKFIGAALFSLGLISVILFGANLWTGKVGYVDSKDSLHAVLIMFGINMIIAFLVGLVYKFGIGATSAFASRLDKTWYRVFLDGIGTGVCIYAAVEGYKKSKSLIPVILGVMAFILAGFEHSVADAFYYGSGELTWKGLGYIGLISLGNATGSLLVNRLQYLKGKDEEAS